MFSGKSEELMRRLRRAQIAGYNVALFKPLVDDRYKKNKVVSHSGTAMPAHMVERVGALDLDTLGYDVVGIDEVQFLEGIVEVVQRMTTRNQTVIVSGLDMTYRGEPFGEMPILLAIAERIDKLDAVCHNCGANATLTQRLIDGKPASFDGPTVQVGGLESYEARCSKCFKQG